MNFKRIAQEAMMNLIQKLLDYSGTYSNTDVLFFTANQVVKPNGHLVMGAGNAKAARDSIMGAAGYFGRNLKDHRVHVGQFDNVKLGALVTKQHFKDPSDLKFVRESLRSLYIYARTNKALTLHVPYPAIGFGGLTREQLDPYMSKMPENVLIYINPKKY